MDLYVESAKDLRPTAQNKKKRSRRSRGAIVACNENESTADVSFCCSDCSPMTSQHPLPLKYNTLREPRLEKNGTPQRAHKHTVPKVTIKPSTIDVAALGLFARGDIERGQKVVELEGVQVLNTTRPNARLVRFPISDDTLIEGCPTEPGFYVNHKVDEPNVKLQMVECSHGTKVEFHALRHICHGEEITADLGINLAAMKAKQNPKILEWHGLIIQQGCYVWIQGEGKKNWPAKVVKIKNSEELDVRWINLPSKSSSRFSKLHCPRRVTSQKNQKNRKNEDTVSIQSVNDRIYVSEHSEACKQGTTLCCGTAHDSPTIIEASMYLQRVENYSKGMSQIQRHLLVCDSCAQNKVVYQGQKYMAIYCRSCTTLHLYSTNVSTLIQTWEKPESHPLLRALITDAVMDRIRGLTKEQDLGRKSLCINSSGEHLEVFFPSPSLIRTRSGAQDDTVLADGNDNAVCVSGRTPDVSDVTSSPQNSSIRNSDRTGCCLPPRKKRKTRAVDLTAGNLDSYEISDGPSQVPSTKTTAVPTSFPQTMNEVRLIAEGRQCATCSDPSNQLGFCNNDSSSEQFPKMHELRQLCIQSFKRFLAFSRLLEKNTTLLELASDFLIDLIDVLQQQKEGPDNFMQRHASKQDQWKDLYFQWRKFGPGMDKHNILNQHVVCSQCLAKVITSDGIF